MIIIIDNNINIYYITYNIYRKERCERWVFGHPQHMIYIIYIYKLYIVYNI